MISPNLNLAFRIFFLNTILALGINLIVFKTTFAETNLTQCKYLDKAGETYVLQNDVSSTGSCFAILNNNITLDLNGHTVTYDNQTPPIVPNGSFESGEGNFIDNWDTSSAPNTQRSAGTYVKPVSIYEGNYALKISLPATDQKIRSLNQITLEPNTTYSISAMLYNNYQNNGYQSGIATLFVGLDDGTTDKTLSRTGITWRGFQYTYKAFTTGSTAETYYLVAGIAGASDAAAGSVYIDDIKIQKHKSMGVAVCPVNWYGSGIKNTPDLNRYCVGNNLTGIVVKNGSIIQGKGTGDYSHAIYVGGNNTPSEYHNLNIVVHGANARAFETNNFSDSSFHDNVISSNVNTITSRDNYDGAAVFVGYPSSSSQIYRNTINSGIQTGIKVVTTKGSADKIQIYENNVTLQAKYTNDFAISSSGSKIYNNTINCGNGNNSCRGIPIGGQGTEVYNNTISVQELSRNQEYNGCEMAGTYGMQMEADTTGIDVYNNTVTANAGECEAYAFRANPYAEGGTGSSNNMVHGNTFIAIKNGAARAATIKYSKLVGTDVNVFNNIFRTNHRWIYVDGGGSVVDPSFSGNRWETTSPLSLPFYPFEVYTWQDSHFSGTFYGNAYGTNDQEKFESEFFRLSNGNIDPLSSFKIESSQNTDTIPPAVPQGLNIK